MINYDAEIMRLCDNMKAVIGIPRAIPEQPLVWESNFGAARMSITIDRSLIQYLHYSTNNITKKSEVFTELTIERWKLVNALICQRFIENGSLGPMVDVNHSNALASLVAFPLIEDICMKWTKHWDQFGKVLQPIGENYNLVNEKGEVRKYKSEAL
jgi:hypothetical protein